MTYEEAALNRFQERNFDRFRESMHERFPEEYQAALRAALDEVVRNLPDEAVITEYGAGTGDVTAILAQVAKPEQKIFPVEIDSRALHMLRRRWPAEPASQIIVTDATQVVDLPRSSLTVLHNPNFDLVEPVGVERIKHGLRPDGQILVLRDWFIEGDAVKRALFYNIDDRITRLRLHKQAEAQATTLTQRSDLDPALRQFFYDVQTHGHADRFKSIWPRGASLVDNMLEWAYINERYTAAGAQTGSMDYVGGERLVDCAVLTGRFQKPLDSDVGYDYVCAGGIEGIGVNPDGLAGKVRTYYAIQKQLYTF